MKRVGLVVAYDGTNYSGWQIQPNGITIQGVLNDALTDLLGEKIEIMGASRTDAGVHALGNVAVFDTNTRIPGEKISGGQKKRVAIAGVLAMNPKILILDEPTAGLDPKGRDEILDQIAELHKVRGITIILVSHSMEDVAKYVERLIVVNHGKIAFDDIPKKVFAHYKELEEMGLAAPQITYIMHALKEKGLPVDPADTTVEEAKQDILHALREMNSSLLKGGVQND